MALSYVPVEPVEDDLFAGLGDVASADALATKAGLELAYDGRKDPREHPQHRRLPGNRRLSCSSCSPSPSGCSCGT